jgi:hypothetical protein
MDHGRAVGETVTPSTDVLIGDADRQYVLIRPLCRRHPDLFDYRAGNWIDCELEVAAGAFRGSFRSDLRSADFQAFLQEAEALSRTLEGAASFATVDGGIAVALSGDGAGQLRVRGEAVDAADPGNRLLFDFGIEQGCLPDICRSLTYLLAAYPVTGAPAEA